MVTEDTGTAPQAPTAIQLRQMEVDAYTQNIAVYQQILSTLDGNWDEDLLPFKNLEGQEAAKACPFDRIERLSELKHYDRISELIKTEIFERSKSQAILNALIALETPNS
jgi:hypothetical protein